MGRYVKKRSDTSSVYYWYPGQIADWKQAGIALGGGLVAAAVIRVFTGNWMWGAAIGFSVAAALSGTYLGRRDARALAVSDVSRLGRIVLVSTAFLRALAKGSLAALAALVVASVAAGGFWAHWLLPLVPAVVGAIAHHVGMFYEQMEKAAAVPVKASESDFAKAVAERRQSLAAAAAGAPEASTEAAAPAPAPEQVGAGAVEGELAAALPHEVDDQTRIDEQARWDEAAYRAEGGAHSSKARRAVFSRRRPGARDRQSV
jgi:hypothetical protein